MTKAQNVGDRIRRWPPWVIAVSCLGCVAPTAAAAAGVAADRAEPRVLAHYMPWFKAEVAADGRMNWDHWQWFGKGPKHDPDDRRPDGRHDIASIFYPLIGPYDSRTPAVQEYHLLTAKLAGIDGFVADWYGPGDFTDEVFAGLVKSAEGLGMKVAICLEEKSFFPGYAAVSSRAEAMTLMERQIRHVLDRYAPSPAYLRRAGRPVFFIFNGHEKGSLGNHWLSPDEIAAVLQRLGESTVCLVRGQAEDGYAGVVDATYGWCGNALYRQSFYERANAQWQEGRIHYRVGPVGPGFNDSGVYGWGRGPRIEDRRGTLEYEEAWRDALQQQPEAVQIVTWNDFQEGTTIEPTVEYGFAFVDLTEQFVETFTGRPARPGDNRWGHRVYELRNRLSRVAEEGVRRAGEARLDAFVRAAVEGRRWLMNWRLSRLEKAIQEGPAQSAPASGEPHT